MSVQRQQKISEIKDLAKKLGKTVELKDFALVPYSTLCLVSIHLQLEMSRRQAAQPSNASDRVNKKEGGEHCRKS
jgi:hypothetical protein